MEINIYHAAKHVDMVKISGNTSTQRRQNRFLTEISVRVSVVIVLWLTMSKIRTFKHSIQSNQVRHTSIIQQIAMSLV